MSSTTIPLVSAAVAVARCASSNRAERLGALSARGASVLDSAQCLTVISQAATESVALRLHQGLPRAARAEVNGAPQSRRPTHPRQRAAKRPRGGEAPRWSLVPSADRVAVAVSRAPQPRRPTNALGNPPLACAQA